ncbi:hypothetical protein Tco_1308822 [Tanacetum coccineum]
MFRVILHLLVETLENPFVAPINSETIEAFMNRVSYQGVIDNVSIFYTKNLAQPWQTMFKVFNRCLTTRTSGHNQIKINILQMFHAVINRTNVDYAALLWWDFMNNVNQKKEAIQYPQFIKLIIADLMKKFPNIPQRIEEDYHSIKDDILLVSVYTTGNVLKRKNTARELCSPRKSHKITIRKKKQSTTLIPPLGDDRERDKVAEATILSHTLHKTALAAEAQENIAKAQDKLDEDGIEKMVEGDEDEESYASEFANSILNDDVDNSVTKIERGSHKENPENVDDDDEEIEKEKKDKEIEIKKKDDNVEKMDKVVKEKDIVNDVTGSIEIGKSRTTVSPTTATTSKDSSTIKRKKLYISYRMRILLGSIAGMFMGCVVEENRRIHEDMELKRRSKLKLKAS